MRIDLAFGVEGAARARGAAVVIDVFRAFTVSACALAGGARGCVLVRTVAEARAVAAAEPGAVISAEEGGYPVPGIPISNSPSMVLAADLAGRLLVQRTSAGTQAAAAASGADPLLAASLVVAGATASRLRELEPDRVTLVCAGAGHVEDRECAELIRARLEGTPHDVEAMWARIRADPRYAGFRAGHTPGFPPADLDLALEVDRFDFAMPAETAGGRLCLVRG